MTIVRERITVEDIIRQNPGLKRRRIELFRQAYGAARRQAAAETGLPRDRFPDLSPFTVDEAEDEDFWPSPVP